MGKKSKKQVNNSGKSNRNGADAVNVDSASEADNAKLKSEVVSETSPVSTTVSKTPKPTEGKTTENFIQNTPQKNTLVPAGDIQEKNSKESISGETISLNPGLTIKNEGLAEKNNKKEEVTIVSQQKRKTNKSPHSSTQSAEVEREQISEISNEKRQQKQSETKGETQLEREDQKKSDAKKEENKELSKEVKTTSPMSKILTPQEKTRTVFVATACHICKILPDGKNVTISTCASCRLISYCGKKHQVEDWKTHKPFCHLVKQILAKENKSHLYDVHGSELSSAEWLEVRFGYMQLFRENLKRELTPFEKEMILFPKLCRICRAIHTLETCSSCHMASFCTNHDKNSQGHQYCRELKIWVDLVRWEHFNGILRPLPPPQCTLKFSQEDFPADIQSFFHSPIIRKNVSVESSEEVWLAGISDVATVPLTILWTMKKKLKWLINADSLTIHLLGAEMDFEGCCASKWETYFMHLLPKLKVLKIVLIGPELLAQPSSHTMCQSCQEENKRLTFDHQVGAMYHEFFETDTYTVPNILCAFNCGLYRNTGFEGEDSWAPTIPLLGKAPLITTAYTETECAQDVKRVVTECPTLKSTYCGKNPFRSFRPQRTLINEDFEPLMYKNQFCAVYIVKK